MAGPGRPRKIQNEASVEPAPQDLINESSESAVETPTTSSFGEEVEAIPDDGFTFSNSMPDVSHISIKEIITEKTETGGNIISLNGWHPIETVIHNGFPVKLTDDQNKEGVIAFWRKTRAFANATHRWQETGKWTDSTTGQNINFSPKFWKDRYS